VLVTLGLVVLVGIVLLAPSLLGQRVFHASDLLERHAPWVAAPPHWGRVTNPLVSDTVDGVGPQVINFAERFRSGELAPLWNGLIMGGRPFAALPTEGYYSPFNAPNVVFPTWYAFGVRKALELAAAIALTFLFLRRIGIGRHAALIGGLVYAYSGFQVVWTNWSQARIGALIPGLFWAVEVVVRSPRLRSAVPLAAISAVMWLEGFPAVTVWALVFAGVYGLVRVAHRGPVREPGRRISLALAGVALGVGLAAFQLLPFASTLGDVDLEAREQQPGGTLARRTLATLAVPDAFGNPVHDNYYGPSDYYIYGPVNYVENQAFLGIAALGMVGMAAAYGGRVLDRRRRLYLWGGVAVCGALIYVGGPLLGAVEAVPFLGSSHIGRLRSVMLFLLAVLAAVGVEAVIRREPGHPPRHAVLVAAYAVIAAIVGAGLLQAYRMASVAGHVDAFKTEILFAAVVGLVVLGIVVASHTRHAVHVVWFLPLVIGFEIVRFAGLWWPQLPVELYYPETPTHRYLAGVVGGERIAVTDRTMLPNVQSIAGLRSVTAHSFSFPEWRDLLLAVDPGVFRLSATYSSLAHDPAVVGSPVLDRLAARYLVVDPRAAVFGEAPPPSEPTGEVTIDGGGAIDLDWVAGTRAVVIALPRGHHPGAEPDEIQVEVTGPGGEVVFGSRIITRPIGAARLEIAVPEPVGWEPVSVRLGVAGDTPMVLGVAGDGSPVVGRVLSADDGLRLVYAADTVIYERLHALGRIRWVANSVIIESRGERIDALAAGVAPDTVVLSSGTPRTGDAIAAVTAVVDDGGDRLIIDVEADGPGYLVISDSMQEWWRVRVDGEVVEPLEADHVGIAIPLGEGAHRIDAVVRPPGWGLGLAVSLLSLLLVTLLIPRRRWWRSGRGRPRGDALTDG